MDQHFFSSNIRTYQENFLISFTTLIDMQLPICGLQNKKKKWTYMDDIR